MVPQLLTCITRWMVVLCPEGGGLGRNRWKQGCTKISGSGTLFETHVKFLHCYQEAGGCKFLEFRRISVLFSECL